MTKVIVNGDYSGFKITGHSGYSEAGSDIVCAAISSAAQLCIIAVTEVMNIPAEVKADNKEAMLHFKISDNINEELRNSASCIIKAFLIQCESIKEDYPDFIDIILWGCN